MYLSKTEIQDSGNYICLASNSVGEADLKLLVSVANVDAYRFVLIINYEVIDVFIMFDYSTYIYRLRRSSLFVIF